ncbi:MAG: undecaprenyl-diphosphate phosphatase [Chthoniobacteraceae bacterium]
MDFFLTAIILGLIEGITEFIPVSSTGHLLIAEHFLKLEHPFFHSEVFNAGIQVGAVLAALPLFKSRLATLSRWREPEARGYFVKLGVSFAITVAGVLIMKKAGLRLPHTVYPVMIALAVTGLLFFAVERWIRGRPMTDEVTWTIAIVVGAAQLLAVAFPGTSRSGATIILALALGMGRAAATEYSFLLGVPTLCAAGAKTMMDALKTGESILWAPLAVAAIVAAASSFLAVRWLLGYVRTHTFVGFGWYRLGLAAVLLVLVKAGLG